MKEYVNLFFWEVFVILTLHIDFYMDNVLILILCY